MSIDLYMLDKLKARVTLARQIDNAQHKIKKANYDRNWLKETAEAMEIELDSDFARLVLTLWSFISDETWNLYVAKRMTVHHPALRNVNARMRTTKLPRSSWSSSRCCLSR